MTDLAILHEDADCIAINKPTNLAIIPGHQLPLEETLLYAVEQHCKTKIFVVHRIDRETSGLVLFAKTAAAHRHFCRQFEMRSVAKEYLAVVEGLMKTAGEIIAPIKQFGSGRMGIDPHGKESKTAYSVTQSFRNATALTIVPHTGRRHQIRVHLYSVNHPILGDTRYGINRPVGGIPRLMLHAHTIQLRHPDNSSLAITAPTGSDWHEQINSFR